MCSSHKFISLSKNPEGLSEFYYLGFLGSHLLLVVTSNNPLIIFDNFLPFTVDFCSGTSLFLAEHHLLHSSNSAMSSWIQGPLLPLGIAELDKSVLFVTSQQSTLQYFTKCIWHRSCNFVVCVVGVPDLVVLIVSWFLQTILIANITVTIPFHTIRLTTQWSRYYHYVHLPLEDIKHRESYLPKVPWLGSSRAGEGNLYIIHLWIWK